MFARKRFSLLLLAVLLTHQSDVEAFRCPLQSPESTLVELSGKTMGTTYHIKFPALSDSKVDAVKQHQQLQTRIESKLAAINAAMSTYIADSTISKFNRSTSTEPFAISADFAKVVEKATEISKLTGGRFDVTVGPLVKFWGFGNSRLVRSTMPAQSEIESIKSQIGFQKLQVTLSPPSIKKSVSTLKVDLSAIAKGYAVDQIAEIVRTKTANFMVEIGGEVFTGGTNPNTKTAWTIGIENPDAPPFGTGARFLAKVNLNETGLATSGNYRNFVLIDGKKYQHTINPTTGIPVDLGVKSVSVAASSCMAADAIATALMVYPPDELKKFASDNELSVLVVYDQDGMTKTWKSKSFPGELLEQPDVAATKGDVTAGPAEENAGDNSNALVMVLGTVVVFGLAIFGMAIGVIVSNRQLKGSCGGLSAMAGKDENASPCSLCTKPASECRNKQEAEAIEGSHED